MAETECRREEATDLEEVTTDLEGIADLEEVQAIVLIDGATNQEAITVMGIDQEQIADSEEVQIIVRVEKKIFLEKKTKLEETINQEEILTMVLTKNTIKAREGNSNFYHNNL